MIGPSADRPVYKQLAGILRQRIESGSYLEGEMPPSAAAMARTFAVGPDTARRALRPATARRSCRRTAPSSRSARDKTNDGRASWPNYRCPGAGAPR
jgi:DNA-binding transcriptional MocR family regulator